MKLLYVGSVDAMQPEVRAQLFNRGCDSDGGVADSVTAIVADVRARGDEALGDMSLLYDGVRLDDLEIPRSEWDRALDAMGTDVRSALEDAAHAVEVFHRAQIPQDIEVGTRPGVTIGRRVEALESVGVYAPGGRAAYPSSVLMGVIPARVAGVEQIIVCTPPGRDGRPSEVVLAACAIAGAHRVFAVGGAGAIAALAYGTASIPAVTRIVGPGNAYVAEAKRQLNGIVSIDSPAGPSEVLVIADATADAQIVAAEMIAQAEHDPDASAVAVIVGAPLLADAILENLERVTAEEERSDIIRQSLASRGAIVGTASLEEALEFARDYAPEHLSLMVTDPRAALKRVRNAGTIFVGAASSVAFGDYMSGANHVLPTNRLARSFSGLSTLDFVRFVTYQEVSAAGANAMAEATRTLALAEGLPAHARAAGLRQTQTAPTACDAPRPLRYRDDYSDIELYEPGRVPCEIDLSDNTNLHGVPPSARAVLDAPAAPLITRYPSVYATELKAALAERHNVAPENIVTACGSDDILDSMIRAFARPKDAVAFPSPTFGVVDLFARMNAATPLPIAHRADLQLDTDALVSANAAVTYICNPNNPTGTLYARASVEDLAHRVSGILAIDEAYADYAGNGNASAIRLAAASDRVVVVRTLSKAYGLAGLRIGYAIANADVAREIEKSRGPYKVGGLAEAAAVAALRSDGDWVVGHAREIAGNRAMLASRLTELGLAALPSHANFLLIPLRHGSATALSMRLREAGIAVRPFRDLPSIGDAIRVTVGPWPLMERFVNALTAVAPNEYARPVE
jgi:histidinol dehydrogenase